MKIRQIIKLILLLFFFSSCDDNPMDNHGNVTIQGGAIQANFKVSNTQKVRFSQGNLQYQATTKTYRFAENQYDIIGGQNSNISESYNNFIDLFGWGNTDNPINSSLNPNEYVNFTDWGKNNISNGGNIAWRTLTKTEWDFLLNSSHKYGFASVNNINGLVLLPDGCQLPKELNFITGSIPNSNNLKDYAATLTNKFSIDEWKIMQSYGAVFLPAAGYRIGINVFSWGESGHYWTSNAYDSENSYCLNFDGNTITPSDSKSKGFSVRLVQDVN